MSDEAKYMHRCLQLAALAAGNVAPNPMVGAILVYEDKIIAEGYHEKYGEPHAEVNCIQRAIAAGYADKFRECSLYVNLEPCAHYGKTPPCADLIIRHSIGRVVVGCRDPFPEVDGKGIERLMQAGVMVEVGMCEKECRKLNKRFFTFHENCRPYIILKWAETANGMIGLDGADRLMITNEITNRLVHKWRSEEAAIMVGTNTALKDDPLLTNRLWKGNSPIRVVVDMKLKLPASLRIFNGEVKTVVLNGINNETSEGVEYYKIPGNSIDEILSALYELKVLSVIVEGGTRLIQSFIESGVWDEARVLVNRAMVLENGLRAPELNTEMKKVFSERLGGDELCVYKNGRLF